VENPEPWVKGILPLYLPNQALYESRLQHHGGDTFRFGLLPQKISDSIKPDKYMKIKSKQFG
jgi:hypothetical protein